jgi:hypothetical protein
MHCREKRILEQAMKHRSLLLQVVFFLFAATAVAQTKPAAAPQLTLPNEKDSVKFLAVGDTGTGSKAQYQLAQRMSEYHNIFNFDFAIMVGDNIYGSENPADFKKKFEDAYGPLVKTGVKFYAALGNHDESKQRLYEPFNMDGKEYYRLRMGDAAFYALNSNYMDKLQLDWLSSELSKDDAKWKIAFFHHPPYSSGGKHGSSVGLRETLEPLFIRYGINAVFTGHEHFYERLKPQNGIYYFITGAGGKLREGNVKVGSTFTAKAYDTDLSFMLVEITKNAMHFQVISRNGQTVDSGAIPYLKK